MLPWLERHGNCPVCRHALELEPPPANLEDTVRTEMENLAHLVCLGLPAWSAAQPTPQPSSSGAATDEERRRADEGGPRADDEVARSDVAEEREVLEQKTLGDALGERERT